MKIRHATEDDLEEMVRVDRKAYGEYGASKKLLFKKLSAFPQGLLVAEDKGRITGFTVFEIMEKDDVPESFCDMKLLKPIDGRWMHPTIFTTKTDYRDKKSDSRLLLAAEKIAKSLGCVESCVPLSKNHPFRDNGAFEFWEDNGYENIGGIEWMPNPKESVECYLYRKKLG
ncbi:MAG: hypothetical protein NT130_01085 [Candidatus Micrarchaeota archaeon]|nr:hypothetical protein [Candidatus Micrarchaeota archaeon]